MTEDVRGTNAQMTGKYWTYTAVKSPGILGASGLRY